MPQTPSRIKIAIGCLRNAAAADGNDLSDADLSYLMDAIEHLEKIYVRSRERCVAERQKGFAKL